MCLRLSRATQGQGVHGLLLLGLRGPWLPPQLLQLLLPLVQMPSKIVGSPLSYHNLMISTRSSSGGEWVLTTMKLLASHSSARYHSSLSRSGSLTSYSSTGSGQAVWVNSSNYTRSSHVSTHTKTLPPSFVRRPWAIKSLWLLEIYY